MCLPEGSDTEKHSKLTRKAPEKQRTSAHIGGTSSGCHDARTRQFCTCSLSSVPRASTLTAARTTDADQDGEVYATNQLLLLLMLLLLMLLPDSRAFPAIGSR